MTNEAVKVELTNSTGNPRRFACSATNAIAKGSILGLFDPRTASFAARTGIPVAGIASMDKESTANGDTSTSITCYTDGIFDLRCSGAVAVGDLVVLAAKDEASTLATNPHVNCIMSWLGGTSVASNAGIIGYALEAGDNAEVINVRLQL